jgi:hypothetical protein
VTSLARTARASRIARSSSLGGRRVRVSDTRPGDRAARSRATLRRAMVTGRASAARDTARARPRARRALGVRWGRRALRLRHRPDDRAGRRRSGVPCHSGAYDDQGGVRVTGAPDPMLRPPHGACVGAETPPQPPAWTRSGATLTLRHPLRFRRDSRRCTRGDGSHVRLHEGLHSSSLAQA